VKIEWGKLEIQGEVLNEIALKHELGLSMVQVQEAREVQTTNRGDDSHCERLRKRRVGEYTSKDTNQDQRFSFFYWGVSITLEKA
jgi:hypothetical protein